MRIHLEASRWRHCFVQFSNFVPQINSSYGRNKLTPLPLDRLNITLFKFSILKNVYFSVVYSYLQYGVTTWGNSAAKYVNKIQTQQNYIVKIMTKSSFYKTKLKPLYLKLKLLNMSNITKLETIKFMYKLRNKLLPKCLQNFFEQPAKLHSHSTRFASGNNYSINRFNKSKSQCSIRYQGPVLWNDLPTKIKYCARKNNHSFTKNVKEFLHANQ